jgi:hypothetical protein
MLNLNCSRREDDVAAAFALDFELILSRHLLMGGARCCVSSRSGQAPLHLLPEK